VAALTLLKLNSTMKINAENNILYMSGRVGFQ